jgi:hypothetical protein
MSLMVEAVPSVRKESTLSLDTPAVAKGIIDSSETERKQAMSGAHGKLERAEHAAQEGNHGGGHNKLFGVTIALIGVLIAFCSARVGSERNALTRSMIEQTQAHSNYTNASGKFRMIVIELEKQHARVAATKDAPAGWSPVDRFVELAADYTDERDLAKSWNESYHPLVDAHFEAAEGYEQAQLIAEIAIVLASLGVLLASRPAWLISIILALGCIVQLGRTYIPTELVVRKSLARIQLAEEAYNNLRKMHTAADEDEKTIGQFDPGRKIRATREARLKNHQPGTLETARK